MTIDGDNYWYRNSAEVLFFRDDKGPGEAFYQWDFLREQGDTALTITKWEGRPFEVVFSEGLSPESVTLYQGERQR